MSLEVQVNLTDHSQNLKFRDTLIIFFLKKGHPRDSSPHCDAIVITLPMANKQIQRILINNRSLADILFLMASTKMDWKDPN